MSKYNFSYSTIADIYATAEEEPRQEEKHRLAALARELETAGVASYDGVDYILRATPYGLEIISSEDLALEAEMMDDIRDDGGVFATMAL